MGTRQLSHSVCCPERQFYSDTIKEAFSLQNFSACFSFDMIYKNQFIHKNTLQVHQHHVAIFFSAIINIFWKLQISSSTCMQCSYFIQVYFKVLLKYSVNLSTGCLFSKCWFYNLPSTDNLFAIEKIKNVSIANSVILSTKCYRHGLFNKYTFEARAHPMRYKWFPKFIVKKYFQKKNNQFKKEIFSLTKLLSKL